MKNKIWSNTRYITKSYLIIIITFLILVDNLNSLSNLRKQDEISINKDNKNPLNTLNNIEKLKELLGITNNNENNNDKDVNNKDILEALNTKLLNFNLINTLSSNNNNNNKNEDNNNTTKGEKENILNNDSEFKNSISNMKTENNNNNTPEFLSFISKNTNTLLNKHANTNSNNNTNNIKSNIDDEARQNFDQINSTISTLVSQMQKVNDNLSQLNSNPFDIKNVEVEMPSRGTETKFKHQLNIDQVFNIAVSIVNGSESNKILKSQVNLTSNRVLFNWYLDNTYFYLIHPNNLDIADRAFVEGSKVRVSFILKTI